MNQMKYTRAEKLKIVKEHVIDGVSLNDFSKKYNYSISIIKYQVQLYLKHGCNMANAILHFDQGWQYQIERYREKIKDLKLVQSMSRKGNCLDNSPTENFFGRMKEEMFYGKENQYKNMNELITAIIQYIEYYNNERIVSRLHMSPIQYRIQNYGLI